MTLLSHHISKQIIVLTAIIALSLPGASMALYSLSHASTQAVSNISSH